MDCSQRHCGRPDGRKRNQCRQCCTLCTNRDVCAPRCQPRGSGPNRAAGEKFLEENKVKEGVQTTASGLQYKVITMGTGEKPTATSKVTVDYEGTLIDGTVFDSSYKRGQPTTFQVNQVIKGWTEALQLMPVGSEWELYIPYQLGYGEREAGQAIKPYSALIFKVKLHGIE
ncbi:MAG: FKBP-type peptidyl-prolyl cis-trans isomerase [Bacteroidaceae bacterium]|nr:FKBP-type peptidyl-prolyl cis-trans isomerase [Bacteroidaceae bacterium]